jgi:hypothetical protein
MNQKTQKLALVELDCCKQLILRNGIVEAKEIKIQE